MFVQRLLQSTTLALALGTLAASPSVGQGTQNNQPAQGEAKQQKANQQNIQQKAGEQNAKQAAGQKGQSGDRPPVIVLSEWNYNRIYDEGWSVKRLMEEAEVYGPGGDEIGSVENIVISDKGRVLGIVAEVGGFIDIGDTHVFVPWNQVGVSSGLARVSIPVTQENVENYSTWADGYLRKAETGGTQVVESDLSTGPRVWRATELMGDDAFLSGNVGYGLVDDLIFTSDGNLHAVIVNAYAGYGGGYYAYPYYGYGYGWNPGHPSYYMGYGRSDIAILDPFDYDKMNKDAAVQKGSATTGSASETQQGGSDKPGKKQ